MFKKLTRLYVRLKQRVTPFPGSSTYWEDRYAKGGNSGAGSYNEIAAFKAEVINGLIIEFGIDSAVEFGCGDGNQLAAIKYPRYVGLDVSPTAVRMCISLYHRDPTKGFFLYGPDEFHDPTGVFKAHMSVSLDVLFHLVEDRIYEMYLNHLFGSAERFVLIYSRDHEDKQHFHVRYRSHSTRIAKDHPEWELLRHISNPLRSDKPDLDNASDADFYLYARRDGSKEK